MTGVRKGMRMKDFLRTTSIGCVVEPQSNALMFLRTSDLRSFTDLLNSPDVEAGLRGVRGGSHWVNTPVKETGETLLETAIKTNMPNFVKTLVKVGALRDQVNPTTGLSPLHLACEKGDPDMLALLLPKDDSDQVDPNVRASDRKSGWTPLHLAAQTPGPGYEACLQLLLDLPDTDVDMKDVRGVQTPLGVAVMASNEAGVRRLVREGASLENRLGRLSLRDLVRENLPQVDLSTLRVVRQRDVMLNLEDKMVALVRGTNKDGHNYKADLANFKTFTRFIRGVSDPGRLEEVLDLACEKGLEDHVRLLLRRGVSPNTRTQPLLEAAYKGHHEVLEVLLADPRTLVTIRRPGTRETVLHLVLKMEYEGAGKEDYMLSLASLLRPLRPDVGVEVGGMVNQQDGLGNTALHYATAQWPESVVRSLLEVGANIGVRNMWGDLPITRIRAQTMQEFLDEFCLQHEGESTMQEDFSITFDYRFLAPDPTTLPEKYQTKKQEVVSLVTEQEETVVTEQETKEEERVTPLPETESLWYMGRSKEHRHLLRHPVITSFLWYKWQRIRKYFNRNLRLYFLFVFLLTWHIFDNFGSFSNKHNTNAVFYTLFIFMFVIMLGYIFKDWVIDLKEIKASSDDKKFSHVKKPSSLGGKIVNLVLSNWVEAIMIVFMVVVIIFDSVIIKPGITALLVVLLFIEIFQLMVSLKRYVFSIENWIEVSMIVIVSVILYNTDGDFELNRNLAAIAIFLSWSKVITLIGKHPKHNRLNIYVTMFFKVLQSFFFFLAWYGLFIIAFGLSFFIMLHDDVKSNIGENKEVGDYVFFNSTFLSVVKTLTMFVGELEFSDIPIDLDRTLYPVNYLFFLTFVFLIVVVLMNLLNGLAVSDTGLIQEQAEIFSHLSRVETISYLESVLLGDPFDFLTNVPRLLSHLPSCSLTRQLYRSSRLRGAFARVGIGRILLFYNQLPEKRSPKLFPNQKSTNCSCISMDEMGSETIQAAKKIVSKKIKASKEDNENVNEDLIQRMQKIEEKLAGLASIETKLNLMLNKMH